MTLDSLSVPVLEKLKTTRYDRIIEKHEGPETWDWLVSPARASDNSALQMWPDYDEVAETPEFLEIGGQSVLLPIGRKRHENLTVLHYFFGEDRKKLVLYLKDTTYGNDWSDAGFVAICDLFAPEPFYVATLYHEWFLIDYDPEAIQLFKSGSDD